MMKLEIEIDMDKVKEDGKFVPESLLAGVDEVAEKFDLLKIVEGIYSGEGSPSDVANFGILIFALIETPWFPIYTQECFLYNDNGGKEDVLDGFKDRWS